MPAAPQYSHSNAYNPVISRSLTSLNISTITQNSYYRDFIFFKVSALFKFLSQNCLKSIISK